MSKVLFKKKSLYKKYQQIQTEINNSPYILIVQLKFDNALNQQESYSLLKENNIYIKKINLNFIKTRFISNKLKNSFKASTYIICLKDYNLIKSLNFIKLTFPSFLILSFISHKSIVNVQYILNNFFILNKIKDFNFYKVLLLKKFSFLNKFYVFKYSIIRFLKLILYYANFKSIN